MRSNFILSLATIAIVLGVVGVAAAQTDSTLNVSGLLANNAAANLRLPAAVEFNQKGLAAIKPVGAHSSVSAPMSSDTYSLLARVDTDKMVHYLDSTKSYLDTTKNSLSNPASDLSNDDRQLRSLLK